MYNELVNISIYFILLNNFNNNCFFFKYLMDIEVEIKK